MAVRLIHWRLRLVRLVRTSKVGLVAGRVVLNVDVVKTAVIVGTPPPRV